MGPTRLKVVRNPSARRMGADAGQRGMIVRREEETDSQLAQTADGGLRLAVDADPEGGQHVGAAAAAGGGTRAVLGNCASGGGDDKGGSGGDIESLDRAGAGARGVQQLRGNCNGPHALVERIGKAGQLIRTFTLGDQQRQGRRDLGIGGFSGQHGADQLRGLVTGKVARRQQHWEATRSKWAWPMLLRRLVACSSS